MYYIMYVCISDIYIYIIFYITYYIHIYIILYYILYYILLYYIILYYIILYYITSWNKFVGKFVGICLLGLLCCLTIDPWQHCFGCFG